MKVEDLHDLADQFKRGRLTLIGLNKQVTECFSNHAINSESATTACAALSWWQNMPLAGRDHRWAS